MAASLVAVDTNILIYLLGEGGDGQQQALARRLFEVFRREGWSVALPTPVAAEYLSGALLGDPNPASVEKAMQVLSRRFVLLGFDARAVAVYARIMQMRAEGEVWRRVREETGVPRRCLLADIAILATAEAHGVPRLYSGETKRRTLTRLASAAGLRIQVQYLDEAFPQPPLPYPT